MFSPADDNSGADPLAAAQPGGEPPADQPQDAADGNSCGRENVDLHDDDSHGNSSSDTDGSEDEDNIVPDDREELLREGRDHDQPGQYHRFTLIPACAVRHCESNRHASNNVNGT